MAGLWLDLDLADTERPRGFPDLDAALEFAHTFAPPTLVVASGHGAHAWHLFEEPWLLNGDVQRAKRIAKLWGKRHQEAAERLGWKVDNVFDLARILRPPGTVNGKGEPLPVELLEHEGGRYSIEDSSERPPRLPRLDRGIRPLQANRCPQAHSTQKAQARARPDQLPLPSLRWAASRRSL